MRDTNVTSFPDPQCTISNMKIRLWRVCFRCFSICARISGQWSDDSVPSKQKRKRKSISGPGVGQLMHSHTWVILNTSYLTPLSCIHLCHLDTAGCVHFKTRGQTSWYRGDGCIKVRWTTMSNIKWANDKKIQMLLYTQWIRNGMTS